MSDKENVTGDEVVSDEVNSPKRREFLAKAGRFAAVTPVAVTVLLSTSMEADAGRIHKSGGQRKPKKDKHSNRKEKRDRILSWLEKLFNKWA